MIKEMFLLLGFAFVAGFVTILSPCIWPLLPILLSSTVAGTGSKRPLGVTLGVMLSFAVITLTLSSVVAAFHFNPNILRIAAVVVLLVLGIGMIIPAVLRILEQWISRLASIFGVNRQREGNGFWAGFLTGLPLGVVWSPCAGPILAAVITIAASGALSVSVVLVTISYVIGIGIPLFFVAYGGQKVLRDVKALNRYTGRIQQVFGVILILAAVAIYTNYDTLLEAKLLNAFPALNTALTSIEQNSNVTDQLTKLKNLSNAGEVAVGQPAPDFIGITKWLNTDKPISMTSLRGKVVLVDFWTYTCINCIRTLPYITSWYDKYKDQGFVVIGVHTPEFAFEHDTQNVQNAIAQFGIHYPVAQDNNNATWNNFDNSYWPAEYLIDSKGIIRDISVGEGDYKKKEQAIQSLLKEAGQNVTQALDHLPDQTPKSALSPETYFGSDRMQYYYPNGSLSAGMQTVTHAPSVPQDNFTLGGTWNIQNEYAESNTNASITEHFYANKVFMVLHPNQNDIAGKITVFLDGKPIAASVAGSDVKNGEVTVDQPRLYQLIDLHGNGGDHILTLQFQTTGIQVYTFTFG